MRKTTDARDYRPDTGCVFVAYTQVDARGQPTSYAGEVLAVEADELVEKWEKQGRRNVRIVHSWPNNGTLLTSSCRGLRGLGSLGAEPWIDPASRYGVVKILGVPHISLPDGRRVRPLRFYRHREALPGLVVVQVAGGGVVKIPEYEGKQLARWFKMRVQDATGGSLVLTGLAGPGATFPQESPSRALAAGFADLGAVLAAGADTSPTGGLGAGDLYDRALPPPARWKAGAWGPGYVYALGRRDSGGVTFEVFQGGTARGQGFPQGFYVRVFGFGGDLYLSRCADDGRWTWVPSSERSRVVAFPDPTSAIQAARRGWTAKPLRQSCEAVGGNFVGDFFRGPTVPARTPGRGLVGLDGFAADTFATADGITWYADVLVRGSPIGVLLGPSDRAGIEVLTAGFNRRLAARGAPPATFNVWGVPQPRGPVRATRGR